MINLTDSLSACTASGILAYAKQIYHQMSGGTATNVEDLLNEHEAEIQSTIKLDKNNEVNITHPFSKEVEGTVLCNLSKDDDKIIQDHSDWGSEFADYVRSSNLYIATNMGNTGIGILGDDFNGYELGEEIGNVSDSSIKSVIVDCFPSESDYWILETETELTINDMPYYGLARYYQTRNFTPFSLEADGNLYLMGVGGYDGDESVAYQSQTLQQVIFRMSETVSGMSEDVSNSLKIENKSLVVGDNETDYSNCACLGVGVNAKGDRAFGFGQTYMTVYVTGSGESDNNDEYPYSLMIGNPTGYTVQNAVAEEFAKTMVGAYLLDITDNFYRYAIINSITYNGQNQPLSVKLDCSLGQKTNAVWTVENIGSGRTFSVGGYGNIGQYGVAMGNYAFNSGKNSIVMGQYNANGGQGSILLGQYNKNSQTGGNLIGTYNTNTGQYSNVIGLQNTNSGQYANIIGRNNNNNCASTSIIGIANDIKETTYPSAIIGYSNSGETQTQQFTLGYENHGTRGQYAPNSGTSCTWMVGNNLITSRGGIAMGRYNKDYDVQDTNKQNFFVIGQGDSSQRLNSVELKANGDLYVVGVGGFNGVNSETATVKTLQAKITELENTKTLLNELNTKMDVLMDDMDVEAKFAYGVQWDKTATSPDCTRVGNMLLHAMLPVQSQMRGCLLNDNGEVVKYLAESGWTEETLDGSMGQVMVEIPEFYWKFTESGNTQTVMLSQVPIEGYAKVSKRYVSAYEATIDNNGNTGTTNSSQYKLASVKNTTARYRGCGNVASNDETYKSGLGMPRTNLTLQTYRESARRRKPSTYEWNCYDYMTHKILYWLFVVEFATRHTQKAVDSTTTISGYKTGGLGNGVTTVNNTEWTNLYGNYPIVPCGTSDSLGNGTGEVSYAVPSSGAGETWTTVKVPRYRGIENPFGHIWKQTDGIKVEVEPGGTTSGESKVYVCYTPTNYNSTSDVINYNYIGNEERSQGNVKEIFFGPSGDLLTSVNGGGSNTYYGDYHYVKTDNTATEYRSVRFGGTAIYGALAGFVCANSIYGLSTTSTLFGSRLCFIPDAT